MVADRFLERWRRTPPLLVDTALALAIAAVTIVAVLVEDDRDHGIELSTYGWVLLTLQIVPLVWRRRAPLLTLVITVGATLAYGMAELPDPPIMFASLLSFYTVAAYSPRRVSIAVALVMVFVAVPIALVFGDESDAADVAVGYFAGITAWAVGDATRAQREKTAWLEERRRDEADRAATDERARIARELHDVVAHHVSVIAVQAEAAQEVFSSRPDRAQQAMADVATTARRALVELRRLLVVLRSDGGIAPQPGLEALDDLVASVRRAGLDVVVHEEGGARPLDAAVALTVYRIVQESLTNVIKHAGARRADVGLTFDHDAVTVSVQDDGRPSSAPPLAGRQGGGQGLVGMRERVHMLGGSLDAGPGEAGGFRVRARIPLDV